MTGLRRRLLAGPRLLAMIVATATLAVGPQTAAAHGPDPMLSNVLYPKDAVLKWTWTPGQEPPAWMKAAVEAGANDSNASKVSRAPTFARAANGKGEVQYGAGVPCGVNGLACARRWPPDDFLVGFRTQGHRFDWGVLNWCQAFVVQPNGCYDVENVMLDELGHVLVLDHHINFADQSDYLDAVVQTMSRAKPQTGWNVHAYGRCDTATLQREYGLPQSAALVSTCLDVDTVTGLTVSKTSVPFGSSVTFNGSLRVATSTAFGQLSSQPLAGRSIRLERRMPGATTWALAATLSPTTTGTYSHTMTVNYTYDYRAVFLGPSNEGLNGSTSSTVRVTVGPCTIPPCPNVLLGTGP